jgi:DNA-binding MarR family transcriptional regulator
MNGEQRVIRAVERVNQRVRRYLSQAMSQMDINEIEAHILARLKGQGPSSVADLQAAFGMRPSTLTNALDRLTAKKYVRRQTSPTDRRSVIVSLTATGTRKATRVIALVDVIESKVAERISTTQAEAFLAVIEAIESSLD